jgi:hypothetical protein
MKECSPAVSSPSKRFATCWPRRFTIVIVPAQRSVGEMVIVVLAGKGLGKDRKSKELKEVGEFCNTPNVAWEKEFPIRYT